MTTPLTATARSKVASVFFSRIRLSVATVLSLRSLTVAPPIALALAAFVIRALGLSRANELFVDELTYARLAQAVSRGQLPNLSGQPFFLHPPGSFAFNGGVLAFLRLTGDKMTLVYDLRWVNAILGAGIVLLAFLIVRQMATVRIALAAGVVLTFDPFILRNDTRVMLETPTMVAALAGLLVLTTALDRSSPKVSRRALVAAGLLFGIAVLTKDVAIFLTAVPVALAAFWRQSMPRREAALAVAISTLPYLVYLIVVFVHGQAALWLAAKMLGVRRLAGAEQTTGFNAPGAPSLAEQLSNQLYRFGTGYVLIASCAVAGVLVAVFGRTRGRRVVGLAALSAGLLGLYAATVGTLEEQYGYYVAVTSVLALAVGTAELLQRWPRLQPAMLSVALVFVILTIALGMQARLVADDGYLQTRDWMRSTLPENARVGLTSPTAEFAFLPDWRQSGTWPSLSSLHTAKAQYVITQSKPLMQGYGYAAPELLEWLKENARPAFVTTGPSGGETVVWQLDQERIGAALADGIDFRPVTGRHP